MVINLRKMRHRLNKFRFLTFLFLGIVLVYYIINSESFLRWLYPVKYEGLIQHYSNIYSVDHRLVKAVIQVESKYDPMAQSPRGAIGLMQIMPNTSEWIASQIGIKDFQKEMLYNPETNIQLGCWYLSSLKTEFNGDLVLMIAAYNGGRGNVKNWLRDGVWDGNYDTISEIPFPETRMYVQKVINTYRVFKKIYPPQSSQVANIGLEKNAAY